jgi:hypothetical protein
MIDEMKWLMIDDDYEMKFICLIAWLLAYNRGGRVCLFVCLFVVYCELERKKKKIIFFCSLFFVRSLLYYWLYVYVCISYYLPNTVFFISDSDSDSDTLTSLTSLTHSLHSLTYVLHTLLTESVVS